MGINAVLTGFGMIKSGLAFSFVGPGGCNILEYLEERCKGCPIKHRREAELPARFDPETVVEQFRSMAPNAVCAAGDEPLFGTNWLYTKALMHAFSDVHTSLITNALLLLKRLEEEPSIVDVDIVSASLDGFRGKRALEKARSDLQEAHRRGMRNLVCSSVVNGPSSIAFIRSQVLPYVSGKVSALEVIPEIDFAASGPIKERLYDIRQIGEQLAILTEDAQEEFGVTVLVHNALRETFAIEGITTVAQPPGTNVFRYTPSGHGSANDMTLEAVSGEPYTGNIDFGTFVQTKIDAAPVVH